MVASNFTFTNGTFILAGSLPISNNYETNLIVTVANTINESYEISPNLTSPEI